MNLKKIFILPVGFLFVHILYIGCCKCITGGRHREVTGLNPYETGDPAFYSTDTVKVKDTLLVQLNLRYKLVASLHKNPFAPLVSSASAFSCDCSPYDDLGLAHPIDSFRITSDRTYKSNLPGSNLNALFLANYSSVDSFGTYHQSIIPISQLGDSLNKPNINSAATLFSTPGVPPEKTHHFTYEVYSNGQRFAYTSSRLVIWE